MPRRWTVMLIPHGSDAPRSIAFTARALHIATWLGVAVALVAIIGLGTIIARLGRFGGPSATTLGTRPSSDLVALREDVARLHRVLDTIRRADANLSDAAGIPTTDTVQRFAHWMSRVPLPALRLRAPRSPLPAILQLPAPASARTLDTAAARVELQNSRIAADSLLDHASRVAERMETLADSATRAARTNRGPRSRAPR